MIASGTYRGTADYGDGYSVTVRYIYANTSSDTEPTVVIEIHSEVVSYEPPEYIAVPDPPADWPDKAEEPEPIQRPVYPPPRSRALPASPCLPVPRRIQQPRRGNILRNRKGRIY